MDGDSYIKILLKLTVLTEVQLHLLNKPFLATKVLLIWKLILIISDILHFVFTKQKNFRVPYGIIFTDISFVNIC